MSGRALTVTPEVTALFHELLAVGDGVPPSRVLANYSKRGEFTRVTAEYPNGWKVICNFSRRRPGVITSVKGTMPPIRIGGRA